MEEITPQELKRRMDAGEDLQLIDVREPYEAEVCSMGGLLVPMGQVLERIGEFRLDVPVVVHCRSGSRSAAVVRALTSRHGLTNLLNLKGGIIAYAEAVDHTIQCDR